MTWWVWVMRMLLYKRHHPTSSVPTNHIQTLSIWMKIDIQKGNCFSISCLNCWLYTWRPRKKGMQGSGTTFTPIWEGIIWYSKIGPNCSLNHYPEIQDCDISKSLFKKFATIKGHITTSIPSIWPSKHHTLEINKVPMPAPVPPPKEWQSWKPCKQSPCFGCSIVKVEWFDGGYDCDYITASFNFLDPTEKNTFPC